MATDVPAATSAEDRSKGTRTSEVATERVDVNPAEARGSRPAPFGVREVEPEPELLEEDSTHTYQPEPAAGAWKPASPSGAGKPAAGRQNSTVNRRVSAAWRERAAARERREKQKAALAICVFILLVVLATGAALYILKPNRGANEAENGKGNGNAAAKTEVGNTRPQPKDAGKNQAATVAPDEPNKKQAEKPPAPATVQKMKELQDAEDAIERAAVYLQSVNGERDARAGEFIRAAEEAAETLLAKLSRSHPNAYMVRGKIHELQKGEESDSFSEYNTGLPDPLRAKPEELPLLMARLEFVLNPKSARYLDGLGLNPTSWNAKAVSDSDVADELAKGTDDPVLKIRALGLCARSRVRAAQKNLPYKSSDRAKFASAPDKVRAAIAEAERNSDQWRCLYEMARQLLALSRDYNNRSEQDDYRKQAEVWLEKAQVAAPPDVVQQRIRPLLDSLKSRA